MDVSEGIPIVKKKIRIPINETPRGLATLGSAFKDAGLIPSSEGINPPETETPEPDDTVSFDRKSIVIRKERRGRSGKTVTVIEGLHLDGSDLNRLARKMRKSLGCGSYVEAGCIVLQGDQVERVRTWLSEHSQRNAE